MILLKLQQKFSFMTAACRVEAAGEAWWVILVLRHLRRHVLRLVRRLVRRSSMSEDGSSMSEDGSLRSEG